MESQSHRGISTAQLETMYRSGYRRFLRLALAVTKDIEVAHDAVQDAFASAIRSRFTFRGEASPEAWLWRIVLNAARNAAASKSVRLGELPEEALVLSDGAEWAELRAAVSALPERQRLVIFLRHYADLDYERIADVLEIERGTVAASLHAAHNALRAQLKEMSK